MHKCTDTHVTWTLSQSHPGHCWAEVLAFQASLNAHANNTVQLAILLNFTLLTLT